MIMVREKEENLWKRRKAIEERVSWKNEFVAEVNGNERKEEEKEQRRTLFGRET